MILKEIKHNVKMYTVSNETLLYLDDIGLRINDDVFDNCDNDYFIKYKSKVIYRFNEGTYIDDQFLNKTVVQDSLYAQTGIFYFDFNVGDLTSEFELINLEDLSVIYSFGRHYAGIQNVIRLDDYIVINFKNQIKCYCNKSYKLLWNIEGDFNILYGYYEGSLYVLESKKNLVEIDIETGSINYNFEEISNLPEGTNKDGFSLDFTNLKLDQNKGLLVGIFHTFYVEIELNTKTINVYNLRDQLEGTNVISFKSFSNLSFNDQHLAVLAYAKLKEDPKVLYGANVLINRNTKTIEWTHVFKDYGLGTNAPIITNDHLYQIDFNGDLYIFER
ncbi:hypothetical protein [Flammeovirga aprica]|uniref:Uncharacterized protein n=1 Tax=Flammeovirga aprica JL-4 TaxID=694437 RepID=A0A7X9RWX2_9BACT|nr:hypothetical protein [Flammeovirga aprica]NME70207.1 hypothetical protein [Flammeovirga aprica JL-4]